MKEGSEWLCIVCIVIISVIFCVKWWIMANNISAIKNKICICGEEKSFDKNFFVYILAGEKAKAKILLFEEIRNTPEYNELFSGVSETFFKVKSEKLNNVYAKHLRALDLSEIDFSLIKRI